MYDTGKRVELVKKRIAKHRRRWLRRSICRLSVLCILLSAALTGVSTLLPTHPLEATGLYGALLLHEDAGGYVAVGVAAFTLAVVLTVLCMRLHERGKQKHEQKEENSP